MNADYSQCTIIIIIIMMSFLYPYCMSQIMDFWLVYSILFMSCSEYQPSLYTASYFLSSCFVCIVCVCVCEEKLINNVLRLFLLQIMKFGTSQEYTLPPPLATRYVSFIILSSMFFKLSRNFCSIGSVMRCGHNYRR